MTDFINIGSMENGEIHYIFDDQSHLSLEQPTHIKPEDLGDITFADGTRAVFINGDLFSAENQTVVLQDENGKEVSGQIVITDKEDLPSGENLGLENTEYVQLIDNNEFDFTQEPHVVYIDDGDFTLENNFSYHIAQIQGESKNNSPFKMVRIDEEQIFDIDDLVKQQWVVENDENPSCQYAVIKDGKIHIQNYNTESNCAIESDGGFQIHSTNNTEHTANVDLSKITGKNLLTGQKITLDGYLDKLQKKVKNFDGSKNERNEKSTSGVFGKADGQLKKRKGEGNCLNGLLNKKLVLGHTDKGKRLVGRIITIKENGEEGAEKKKYEKNKTVNVSEVKCHNNGDGATTAPNNSNPLSNATLTILPENLEQLCPENYVDDLRMIPENDFTNIPQVKEIISEHDTDLKNLTETVKALTESRRKYVTKECLEQLSRTLAGLMSMDSVRKKLQYKNVVVRVVEKTFSESTGQLEKKVAYGSGYMEEQYVISEEDEMREVWAFVPDRNTKEAVFGSRDGGGDDDDDDDDDHEDDEATENIYTDTTHITVLMSQGKNGERVIRVVLDPKNNTRCPVCSREFRNAAQLKLHTTTAHPNMSAKAKEGAPATDVVYQCSECGKKYSSVRNLRKHMNHHAATNSVACSICAQTFPNDTTLKKHMISHTVAENVECETCGKKFNDAGELKLHKRVHEAFKYFACDTCGRTFSRHSNLQRHVYIHKGTGALYRCVVCGCSYQYLSTLTRHVVQNHVAIAQRNGSAPSTDQSISSHSITEETTTTTTTALNT